MGTVEGGRGIKVFLYDVKSLFAEKICAKMLRL